MTTVNSPLVTKANVMEIRFWRARQELMNLVINAIGGKGSTNVASFDLIEIKPGTWVDDEGLWLETVTFTFAAADDGTDLQFTLVNKADGKLRWAWGANPEDANNKHLPQETVYWLNHLSFLIAQALEKPVTQIQKFEQYRDNAGIAWENKVTASATS